MLGKPPSQEAVGESWEVWEGDRVASEPYRGATLREIAERFPQQLLGPIPLRQSKGRFPLLTKFIDAQEPLSVQVHPNDRQAQELEGQPNGKTEAWHIIGTAPDAWIIHGVENSVSREELRRRLEDGTADNVLHKIRVSPGDTVFMPAGTIHAIGPGVLLHEVQQTSEVTYRLYDWNRQSHGSRRQLHLDKGLAVSSLQPSRNVVVTPLEWREGDVGVSLLLATEYFTVKKMELSDAIELDTRGNSFHILTMLGGVVEVCPRNDSARTDLKIGQSLLLPAALGSYDLVPRPDASILVEWVADVPGEVVTDLRDRGFDGAAIKTFLEQFASV